MGELQITQSQKKTAEVLLSIPPKKAAEVIKPLEEHELLFVGEAILRHININARQAQSSIDQDRQIEPIETESSSESKQLIKVTDSDFSDIEVVKALYRLAFGQKKAESLISKLLRKQLQHKLSFLSSHTPEHIFKAIEKESPLVMSVVMVVLPANQSAKLLQMFEESERAKIIKNIIAQKNPSDAAINIIHDVLKRKLNAIVQEDEQIIKPNGVDNLVNILRFLPAEAQEMLTNTLEDQTAKEHIEYKLFSWNNLFELTKEEVATIITQYNDKDIAKMILLDGKDALAVLKKYISDNRMSMIDEELGILTGNLKNHSLNLRDARAIKTKFFKQIQEKIAKK